MDQVNQIFFDIRKRFTWVSDEEQFHVAEDWRSYADQVERGEAFGDDCDSHAMTCADLAVRRGIDPARVRVALCLTEVGQRHVPRPLADHMVCLIDTDGGTVALDNRQRAVLLMQRLGYEWDKFMSLDRPGEWRSMRNMPAVEIARPVAPVPPFPINSPPNRGGAEQALREKVADRAST